MVYFVLSYFYDNDVDYETFLNTYFSVDQCKNENKIKPFVKSLERHLKRILVQLIIGPSGSGKTRNVFSLTDN